MKALHSVRSRIILLITVLFVVLLALYTVAMWSVADSFALYNYSQNTAFTLSVLGTSIDNDLDNIDSLSSRVSIDIELKSILANFSESAWTDYYQRFESMVQSNPAWHAVDRFIVTDSAFEHFLQVGTAAAMGRPLRQDYLLDEIAHVEEDGVFSDVFASSLSYGTYRVMAILRPIIDYNTGLTLGYVYAAVNVDALLSNLYYYQRLDDSELYLTLGGSTYRVENNFIRLSTTKTDNSSGTLLFSNSTSSAYTLGGGRNVLKTTPQGAIFSIVQIFENPSILAGISASLPLTGIAITIVISVCLVAIVLAIYLNGAIYKPVRRLSKSIERIQNSDFSQDESINTEDEFGIIGRGINKLSGEVTDLMDRRVEDERKKLELEYRMLQNQINPHFLYNTFNSIKWMATIQGATGIGEMITSLSRLMKNISKRDASLVPLSEELSFIDDYLVIMKYRYGNTISSSRNIQPSCQDLMLPRFTLQPLVENAIFHGIEPRGTGAIAINAQEFDDHYTIMVADNGVGFDQDKAESKGKGDGVFKSIGVDNIRQRLEYTYHEKASFHMESRVGLGTKCIIIIRKDNDEEDAQP